MALHPAGALALRRCMIALVATIVTLAAHVLGAGHGLEVVRLPVTAGFLAVVGIGALMIGRHAGPFRRRGPLVTLGVLLGAQLVAHLAMVGAPWVVGLDMPHHTALITPAMALVHALATLLLLPVVSYMEHLLARAVAVVRRLRRLFARPAQGASGARSLPLRRVVLRPAPVLACTSARGPPLGLIPR